MAHRHDRTAWERSMHPAPSIPVGLAHYAAELFGSLLVIGATLALMAATVFGLSGTPEERLAAVLLAAFGVPAFAAGRYLIAQHGVSHRKPESGPGGGGFVRAVGPPAPPSSGRERHVVAGRRPAVGPVRARPRTSSAAHKG